MNLKSLMFRSCCLVLITIPAYSGFSMQLHGNKASAPESKPSNTASNTEPLAQPTSLTFVDVKTYHYKATFKHANPKPGGYIVLRSKTHVVNGVPVDGTTYSVGDVIGNARVVYKGSDSTFTPRGIVAGTRFHHSVFSFNGSVGSENYLQASPLTGFVDTPANMIGNFYEGINSNSSGFLEQLQLRIRPHTSFPYASYINVMINGFEAQDTTGGQKVVYCVYSGYAHVYNEPFGWIGSPGGTLSREHTFAHSWYPTHPSNSGIEYSDFYNLFPTHQNNVNNRRSNHPLGIVQNVTYQFMDGKLGTDALGNTVYEPRDAQKGDAARALFYMVTRYHNWDGNQWFLPAQQNQDVLKLWHFTDPPDPWEIARNDYIHSHQNNRNPFVDSIHFALKIDFHTMQSLSIHDIERHRLRFYIYPNPANNELFITVESPVNSTVLLKLYDLHGILILSSEHQVAPKITNTSLNLNNVPQGSYILQFLSGNESYSTPIIRL